MEFRPFEPGDAGFCFGVRSQAFNQKFCGELTAEQIQKLNDISEIELGFPHDFLNSDEIKDIVYGGTLPSIYNHRV